MSLEFFSRLQRELSVTGSALYETVLAVSERVNRKVQIMRLHWQASTLLRRNDRNLSGAGSETFFGAARCSDQTAQARIDSRRPVTITPGPQSAIGRC